MLPQLQNWGGVATDAFTAYEIAVGIKLHSVVDVLLADKQGGRTASDDSYNAPSLSQLLAGCRKAWRDVAQQNLHHGDSFEHVQTTFDGVVAGISNTSPSACDALNGCGHVCIFVPHITSRG